MNTPGKAVIKFMEENNFGVFGDNLYYGRVPGSISTKNKIYWIVPSAGSPTRKNVTGEITKMYPFYIYYRTDSVKDLEEKLFELDQTITSQRCYNLDGFQTVDFLVFSSASEPMQDSENRDYGFLVINVQIHDITKVAEPESN